MKRRIFQRNLISLANFLTSNIKLNSANENKYQYGNTTNVTANVFYMFNLKEVTFVPFMVLIMKKQIMIETQIFILIQEGVPGIAI